MKESDLEKKWNIHRVVQEAVEKSHTSPSPQTLLELGNLKKDMASNNEAHITIMEKLDNFGEKLEEMRVQLAELPEKIFEKGDERYASKNVEKVLYGLIGVILTAFVVGLWELVNKWYIKFFS